MQAARDRPWTCVLARCSEVLDRISGGVGMTHCHHRVWPLKLPVTTSTLHISSPSPQTLHRLLQAEFWAGGCSKEGLGRARGFSLPPPGLAPQALQHHLHPACKQTVTADLKQVSWPSAEKFPDGVARVVLSPLPPPALAPPALASHHKAAGESLETCDGVPC